MKKISLNKTKEIYDEVKLHKKLGHFVRIYIHDDELKVGYNNRFGVSSFIKNNDPKFLVMNEDKLDEILQDYWKKDAVKILQEWINDAIDEYLYVKKNTYFFKKI